MWKIAWRNLWRNRTRTFIVGSAIAFSYAMMLVSMGINDDTHAKMELAAEVAAGGSILIHHDGWWESQASDLIIETPQQVFDAASTVQGIQSLIPRVVINGLASSPRGNEPVRLAGVDPLREFALKDLSDNLIRGQFFGDEYESPILLSESLAEKLRLELGDRVVLTASTPDGEVTRALFHLDGILRSGLAGEAEFLAYTTVQAAQRAVNMGDALTQIGVLIAPGSDQQQVATRLQQVLTQTRPLEVLTWQEAIPEMIGFIQIDNAFGYIYMIVIFIIVLFAIANTFLMAVMERVREYGLMNAIGLSPTRIGALVVWESIFLAMIAMAVGFAVGYGLHLYIDYVGIDAAAFGVSDLEMAGVSMTEMIIRSEVRPIKWLIGSLSVFAIVMISSLYPAWRATQLAPAEAMRFYE